MTDALIAARFVHFAALIVLFGGSLFPVYAVPTEPALAASFFRRLRRVLRVSGVLAILSALLWFADFIANSTGDWNDVLDQEVVRSTLFETAFGTLFLWRVILLIVLLVIVLTRKGIPTRRARIVFAALAAIALASLALTGHADTPKGFGGNLHRLTDAVHLLAAGTWLGGLVPLGLVLGMARHGDSDASTDWARRMVPRFSTIGYWAVGLVLLTGAINGVILVGHWDSLTATAYGQFLLIKLTLVLILVGFAVINRLRLMPPLLAAAGPSSVAPLWRNVVAEQGLGLTIVALVSVLGTLVPAMYH